MSGLQTPDPLLRGGPAAWKGPEVPLGLQEGSASFWNDPERSEEQGDKGKNEPVDGGHPSTFRFTSYQLLLVYPEPRGASPQTMCTWPHPACGSQTWWPKPADCGSQPPTPDIWTQGLQEEPPALAGPPSPPVHCVNTTVLSGGERH
ncbi:hypothetical protein MJT46_001762 [Ovis ammon polii x Ovis aries]|nr:hypothetical protein MJT46_001762 [Ovis ammon polii x Ovis aries]